MIPTDDTKRRLARNEALVRLREAAREECARVPMNSREHEFYLGAQAAAEDVLHPERAGAKPDGWLLREDASFREGYHRTVALVANARMADANALTLPLPAFDPTL